MPEHPEFPVAESDMEKVMHVSFPISKETVLMGSDPGGDWASNFKRGNNFSVSINTDCRENADRLFNAFSEGGKITMPIANTYWVSCFGMLTDQFDIQWMVSFDISDREK